MEATESGMVISVKLLQLEKTQLPMEVTPSSIITFVIAVPQGADDYV